MVSLWVVFYSWLFYLIYYPYSAKFFQKISSFYRQKMPRLSLTERQALTVGNVGWEGELFSGMPD